jgi:hypothetical protein
MFGIPALKNLPEPQPSRDSGKGFTSPERRGQGAFNVRLPHLPAMFISDPEARRNTLREYNHPF